MQSVRWLTEMPSRDRIALAWVAALLAWILLSGHVFSEQVSVVGAWILAVPFALGVVLLFLDCVWSTIKHMRDR